MRASTEELEELTEKGEIYDLSRTSTHVVYVDDIDEG